MTSNMIAWTEPAHDNAHRGEDADTCYSRARTSLAGARGELQHLVNQLIAAGASRVEIARNPAFQAGIGRARAYRVELAVLCL